MQLLFFHLCHRHICNYGEIYIISLSSWITLVVALINRVLWFWVKICDFFFKAFCGHLVLCAFTHFFRYSFFSVLFGFVFISFIFWKKIGMVNIGPWKRACTHYILCQVDLNCLALCLILSMTLQLRTFLCVFFVRFSSHENDTI